MNSCKRLSLLLALVLLTSMLLSGTAMAVKVSDFEDVPAKTWYRSALSYAVSHGIVSGTSSTTFSPNANVTRGQFAVMLANALGGKGTNTGYFTDVPKGRFYSSAVYWGYQNGIISGTGKNTFSPDASITRQDLAAMMGRAIAKLDLDVPDAKKPAAQFSDISDAAKYAVSAIELLRQKGILSGYKDGTVRPTTPITRAEAMFMLVTLHKLVTGYTGGDEDEDDDGIACPSKNGALHVEGTQLVDEFGEPVQLRGVSTHGIAWYSDYVNQKLFTELREQWGANVVRLAMYTADNGGYCTGGDKAALKQLIRNGVKYATNADMYVVVDWHILSDGNPNTYKSQAIEFFREMSREFKNHNNVIYEICNEPNGGTSWSQIKSYAGDVIPEIRKNDPDAVIIVGTPTWSQEVKDAAADPIKNQKNIMYALHFYAATHKADLRNKMVDAIKAGLPVFVSEYGICDASGNGNLSIDSANEWVKTMDNYGVSYICWNLSNKNESSALIRSSCSKTSGFTESELSEEGKWLLGVLAGKGFDGTPPDTGDGSGSGTSGSVSWEANLKSSWASDNDTFYQYDITITNSGSSAINSWAIDIPFNGSFDWSDKKNKGWGGVFSKSGNTMHITNVDYNGSIAPGASVTNVGFIIKGSSSLKIVSK